MLRSHLTTVLNKLLCCLHLQAPVSSEIPLVRYAGLGDAELPADLRRCAVTVKYLRLLAVLDWSSLPDRVAGCYRGVKPRTRIPYVAAYLVKLDQGLRSMGALNDYLNMHPTLAGLLGFGPKVPLPSEREWARILRTMHNPCLQVLLDQSVTLLQQELSAMQTTALGDEISLDTKHILAWVRENNPKQHVKERFNKTKQPKGDPDCKLGCKERTNQRRRSSLDAPTTPTTQAQPADTVSIGTFYWGYASGLVVCKVAGVGEIVLAEMTQPFNAGETTYFYPLMQQVEQRLGRTPRFGALDAAFDAFYVYDYFHEAGGYAAVPLSQRGKTEMHFAANGNPLCAAGYPMSTKHTFMNNKGLVPQQQSRYACPLTHPQRTGDTCPIEHKKWNAGGCIVTMGTSAGARLRHQLDRESAEYKHLYHQRTAVERIFSQTKALGMETPKLRNQHAITNLNTLIYVLINLRTLQRVRARNNPR